MPSQEPCLYQWDLSTYVWWCPWKKTSFCIISLNRRVPKACEVRFVLSVVLFWEVFFPFFFVFVFVFETTVYFSCQQDISSTLELYSLRFWFFCWLLRLACCCCCCCWWAYFRDVPGLAYRSKFRSLCLRTEGLQKSFFSVTVQNS